MLKCDIKKFFASIDQETLVDILTRSVDDWEVVWLLERVIESFRSSPGKGLPLGNLTSQLLVNVYMNEFDQFMKHNLKAKYYLRYADDFVIFSHDKRELEKILPKIKMFLSDTLKLELHPNKVFIKTLSSGVDFLGWVNFPNHKVLRTVTKRRMFKNLSNNDSKESLNSYLGLLKHGNTGKIRKILSDR